jgi:hypothetical protein
MNEELVECVTVEVRMPKAFVDEIQKQDWFTRSYRDLDDFAADAMRRLKTHYK